MTILGLLAMLMDAVFVGAVIIMLRLLRPDGAGATFDVLTAVLIAAGIVLCFFAARVHEFMSLREAHDPIALLEFGKDILVHHRRH